MVSSTFSIKFVGPWKETAALLDPTAANARIKKNFRRAMEINGLIFQASIRKAIKNARSTGPRLKTLTIILRGGTNTPLIETSTMMQSVTSQVTSWNKARIGLFRGTVQAERLAIAGLVHQGHIIRITQKMRGLFFVLWLATTGKISPDELTSPRAIELYNKITRVPGQTVSPIPASKNVFVVPARPFIHWAFWLDKASTNKAIRNFHVALIKSFSKAGVTRPAPPSFRT